MKHDLGLLQIMYRGWLFMTVTVSVFLISTNEIPWNKFKIFPVPDTKWNFLQSSIEYQNTTKKHIGNLSYKKIMNWKPVITPFYLKNQQKNSSVLEIESKVISNRTCQFKIWITVDANGRLGNQMCEYAHLKELSISYGVKVSFL